MRPGRRSRGSATSYSGSVSLNTDRPGRADDPADDFRLGLLLTRERPAAAQRAAGAVLSGRRRLRAFTLDNVTGGRGLEGLCGPAALSRRAAVSGPPQGGSRPGAGDVRLAPPNRAPPYRGVCGSTVGGAHTTHAWPARFHVWVPDEPIAPVRLTSLEPLMAARRVQRRGRHGTGRGRRLAVL
jgi:hypothetical protein